MYIALVLLTILAGACSKPSYRYPVCRQTLPFQHPTDCTKFFVCAPWGKQIMSCAPGTHFNPTIHVCDWPQAAGCIPSSETVTPKTPVPETVSTDELPEGNDTIIESSSSPTPSSTSSSRPDIIITEKTTSENQTSITDISDSETSESVTKASDIITFEPSDSETSEPSDSVTETSDYETSEPSDSETSEHTDSITEITDFETSEPSDSETSEPSDSVTETSEYETSEPFDSATETSEASDSETFEPTDSVTEITDFETSEPSESEPSESSDAVTDISDFETSEPTDFVTEISDPSELVTDTSDSDTPDLTTDPPSAETSSSETIELHNSSTYTTVSLTSSPVTEPTTSIDTSSVILESATPEILSSTGTSPDSFPSTLEPEYQTRNSSAGEAFKFSTISDNLTNSTKSGNTTTENEISSDASGTSAEDLLTKSIVPETATPGQDRVTITKSTRDEKDDNQSEETSIESDERVITPDDICSKKPHDVFVNGHFEDCKLFITCSMGISIVMPCPGNSPFFDSNMNVCTADEGVCS